jgi:hypothetical protein
LLRLEFPDKWRITREGGRGAEEMFLTVKTRRVSSRKPDFGVEFLELPSLKGFEAKTWKQEECEWCIFLPNQLDYSVMPGVWSRCNACDGFGWNWRVVKKTLDPTTET